MLKRIILHTIVLLTVLSVLAVPGIFKPTFVSAVQIPGTIYGPFQGHYYQIVATEWKELSWDNATSAAAALPPYMGMSPHLATITSAEEQAYIATLPGTDVSLWLGASDAAVEGTWEWITGEPFVYSNWNPNSGDDAEPNGATVENYLEWNNSWWVDNNNVGRASGYIVEYECTNTPVLYTTEADFNAGLLSNVDTASSPGDVRLSKASGKYYIYALQGNSYPAGGTTRKGFWRYDITADNWTLMADFPVYELRGGAMTSDGTYIYALRGWGTVNGTREFYRYDPALNSWSRMADTPGDVYNGSLTCIGNTIYAQQGGNALRGFWAYNILTNTWDASPVDPTGFNIHFGNAMADNVTHIFATAGDGQNPFFRYSITEDFWSYTPDVQYVPTFVSAGSGLSRIGDTIYMTNGGNSEYFYGYSIAGNSWTQYANTVVGSTYLMNPGGSLTNDGTYVYALTGGWDAGLPYFLRYNPTTNAWSKMHNTPGNVSAGGALATVQGYTASGTIASEVLDTGKAGSTWNKLSWTENATSGTDITFEVRASNTLFLEDAASPDWVPVSGDTPISSGLPKGQYMQWRATLTTANQAVSPILSEVVVDYTAPCSTQPGHINIVKQVIGAVPSDNWTFNGTSPIGTFTLPAAGGAFYSDNLTPGSYTITETVKDGYFLATVAIGGSSNDPAVVDNSAIIDLIPGENVTITFTNIKDCTRTTNLALGKVVIPLTETAGGEPGYVNDNNPATCWYSSAEDPTSVAFILDLGNTYSMGKIELWFSQICGYVISSSSDNITWTERYTRDNYCPSESTNSQSPALGFFQYGAWSARFIKVYAWTNTSFGQYTGVGEIKVYEWLCCQEAQPVASFIFHDNTTSHCSPLTVGFEDTSVNGPTSWAWDFGDGGTSVSQNPTHQYAAAGIYTCNLTASNCSGSSWYADNVTVNECGDCTRPVANFTASPLSGCAPLRVCFTDTSLNYPLDWIWDFNNDGKTDSTSQNPCYTFTTPGTYTVTFMASNNCGSDNETKAGFITVRNCIGGTSTGSGGWGKSANWQETETTPTGSSSVATRPYMPTQLPNVAVQRASLSASTAEPNVPVTVTALIGNTGTANGVKTVKIYVNGQEDASTGVAIDSGQTRNMTFTVSRSEPGTYSVYVDSTPAGSFTVSDTSGSTIILVISSAAVLIAIAGLVYMARRRQGQF